MIRGARLVAAALAGLALSILAAPAAYADPAAPTDYQSEVVAVEPPTSTITPGIVGGDSFFELSVANGTEVFVIGYQGEPMVWFRADGTVWENRNSPSTYLNESRLGGGGLPPNATVDAEPDWEQVASDGNWSWHDHRAHWMQTARPFGLGPGDQILESVIPLVIDGADVDVTVISTWQPAPSPVAAILGVIAGIASVVGAWLLRRTGRPMALVAAIPIVVFALIAGVWQFTSLPPETGPRAIWWVLPAIAAFSLLVGLAAEWRSARFVADGALLFVGVELAIWGFAKRSGLSAAIIPTGAPEWFDRFTTSMALLAGVGFGALALWWLLRLRPAPAGSVSGSREPSGSPRPAHP